MRGAPSKECWRRDRRCNKWTSSSDSGRVVGLTGSYPETRLESAKPTYGSPALSDASRVNLLGHFSWVVGYLKVAHHPSREQAFLKGSACYNLVPRALTIPRHCDSPLRGSRHEATVSIFSLDAWVCISLCLWPEACRRRKRARPSSILANRYSPDQYLLKPI
jgi:hypothetical protein